MIDVATPAERITSLLQQIDMVRAESARLTEGEWALLMMLQEAVRILDALQAEGRKP